METNDVLLGKGSKQEIAIVGRKGIYKKQTQISQIVQKTPNYTLLVKTIAVFIYKKMLLGGDSKLYVCYFRCNFPHSILLWCHEYKKRHTDCTLPQQTSCEPTQPFQSWILYFRHTRSCAGHRIFLCMKVKMCYKVKKDIEFGHSYSNFCQPGIPGLCL